MNVQYQTKAYYLAFHPKEQQRGTCTEGLLFDPMYARDDQRTALIMEVFGYDCQASFYVGGDNRRGEIRSLALVTQKPLPELVSDLKKDYKITGESMKDLRKNRMCYFRIKPAQLERLLADLSSKPAKYLDGVSHELA